MNTNEEIVTIWTMLFRQMAKHLNIHNPSDSELCRAIEAATRYRLDRKVGLANIVFISGADGVGKTTVQNCLIERGVRRCRNVYTRPLRPGEKTGIDVIYMDTAAFIQAYNREEFLFTTVRHGSILHGVLWTEAEELLNSGDHVFMERSARSLPELLDDPFFNGRHWASVYLLPPDAKELVRRFGERQNSGGDPTESLTLRLAEAASEFPNDLRDYDGCIVCDDPERVADIIMGLFVPK